MSPPPPSFLHPIHGYLRRGLFASLALTACADLEAVDDEAFAPADGDAEPDLDQDETAERLVASLPVEEAGRVDIVDAGPSDAPNYVYITVGGSLPVEVLDQLVQGEGATPAEVFLALAAEGEALPPALLADHRVRASADPSLAPAPRLLAYKTFRTAETENLSCYVSSPLTFNQWLSDWDSRFEFINYHQPYRYTARDTTSGIRQYTIVADTFGRVMSACNSDGDDDIDVSYWVNIAPGTNIYSKVWSSPVNSYEAAHLYSQGSAAAYRMRLDQSQPDPDTYVAYGRCGGGPC